MKLFPRLLSPAATLLCLLIFSTSALLTGCGHQSRPASSLSEKDRTILAKYEDIRAALAVDDLRAAKRAGKGLATFLKPTPDSPATPLDGPVGDIAEAPMLDKAREAFLKLSNDLVPTTEGVEGFYVMEAPMPVGAVWIQPTAKVENPYVGKPMRDTGNVRK